MSTKVVKKCKEKKINMKANKQKASNSGRKNMDFEENIQRVSDILKQVYLNVF